VFVGAAGVALAQQQNGAPTGGQPPVAEACLTGLIQFVERVARDGYWLPSYRRGWGWRGYAPTTMAPAEKPPATTDTVPGAGPYAPLGRRAAPDYELEALQQVAAVLVRRGDAEGCRSAWALPEHVHVDDASELEQAAIEPGEVSAWRQAPITAAEPVDELNRSLSTRDITGIEVRSPGNGYFGTIEDVVAAGPQRIRLRHRQPQRLLGIGEEYLAVPWQMLEATLGLATFILDASEKRLADAPAVGPARA
jgi:hypothetical protein